MKKEIKKLKEFRKWFNQYITRNFGKKCPEFVWNCLVCRAHFVKEILGDFIDDLIEDENWLIKQNRKPRSRKLSGKRPHIN